MSPGCPRELIGQPLNVERAAPQIDNAGYSALLREHELRIAGDAGGKIRRQCKRLVQRIGVQRLRVSLRRCHRLDSGAHHVVEYVLGCKRPAGGLAMGAQRQRARVLGGERLHQLCPEQARRPQLRDLHEEVHADRPEERDARRKPVDIETRVEAGTHIFHAVGQRVGELQVRRRACLLHVIARHGDRVELRHVRRREGKDVGDDAQRCHGRIDIGVAHHELFEDVVLNGAGELLRLHSLLLGCDDVEREHRQDRTIHGHRHRRAVERDAGKQRAHVVDRVDGHSRHADIATHARVIGIVAAMGSEIESNREPHLSGRQIAPVEGVRFLGGGEAGILPDGPRLGHVHGRIGAAQVGRDAGEAI